MAGDNFELTLFLHCLFPVPVPDFLPQEAPHFDQQSPATRHVITFRILNARRRTAVIEDTISRAIVTALRVNLAGLSGGTLVRAPTDDLPAYELYLKGRYFCARPTRVGPAIAVRYFEQAVAA